MNKEMEGMVFFYDSMYVDYKRAIKKQKKDSLYKMRIDTYEKNLKIFQGIIKTKLKMKMDFVKLESEK